MAGWILLLVHIALRFAENWIGGCYHDAQNGRGVRRRRRPRASDLDRASKNRGREERGGKHTSSETDQGRYHNGYG